MLTRKEEDVTSHTDPNVDIKGRVCVAEGGTISLIALYSKARSLRFLAELNGFRGIWDGINKNGYSRPPHKEIIILCLFFIHF